MKALNRTSFVFSVAGLIVLIVGYLILWDTNLSTKTAGPIIITGFAMITIGFILGLIHYYRYEDKEETIIFM